MPENAVEASVWEQIAEDLQHIRLHSTRTSEFLASGIINNVLEVGTWTFDSLGAVERAFRATCGSIEVTNYGTAFVTVTGSGRGSRPNGGPGVMRVDPGESKVVNVASRVVTIWGIPGETVTIQAFTIGGVSRRSLASIDGGAP